MANLISSSISIGSLNKHKFVEILLTACNYYQLQSTSRLIPKRSVIKRLTDSTTSTTSGQTDTTSGQTSTTSGQTGTTNGETNGQESTTSG